MKISETQNQFMVHLSPQELWFLAQLFGPGLIFGVDDPTEDLTEEEIQAAQVEVYNSLKEAGLLNMEGSNQLQIDEILGSMVYSTIHSADMLTLKQPGTQEERFYHFLPEWQLSLRKLEDGYLLTLFKERTDLFPHIIEEVNATLHPGNSDFNFTVKDRDLELAAFLYESDKKEQALEVLASVPLTANQLESFIQGYIAPEAHLVFDMLYSRDDEEKTSAQRSELLQTEDALYWLSHVLVGDEKNPFTQVETISPEAAQTRFNALLPVDQESLPG